MSPLVIVIIGIVVMFGLFFVGLVFQANQWAKKREQDEERARDKGKATVALIVMANDDLLSGRSEGGPAAVLVDASPEPHLHLNSLRETAKRVYKLYTTPDYQVRGFSEAELRVAEVIKDHRFVSSRRTRLPNEFAGERTIYLLDLWLYAERIGPGTLGSKLIPCLMTGGMTGEIAQISHLDSRARTVLQPYEQGEPTQEPVRRASPRAAGGGAKVGDALPARRARVRPSQDRPEFGVVLANYDQLDPGTFASLFEDALGMLPYDAVAAARDSRGILGELGISEESADRLVEGLAGSGIAAYTVPAKRLLRIGKPTQVRMIEPREDGLWITLGYSPEPRVFTYDRLILASGGRITETRLRPTPHRDSSGFFKRRPGDRVFAGLGLLGAGLQSVVDQADREAERARKRPGSWRHASTEVGVADLFLRENDGSFLHVRLRNRDLYYSKILGKEAVNDFKVNFSQVLCRILNKAPLAAYNPGLECMVSEVANVDPAEAEFGSEKEFTAFTRWLLQVVEIEDLIPNAAGADLAGTPFELTEEEPRLENETASAEAVQTRFEFAKREEPEPMPDAGSPSSSADLETPVDASGRLIRAPDSTCPGSSQIGASSPPSGRLLGSKRPTKSSGGKGEGP